MDMAMTESVQAQSPKQSHRRRVGIEEEVCDPDPTWTGRHVDSPRRAQTLHTVTRTGPRRAPSKHCRMDSGALVASTTDSELAMNGSAQSKTTTYSSRMPYRVNTEYAYHVQRYADSAGHASASSASDDVSSGTGSNDSPDTALTSPPRSALSPKAGGAYNMFHFGSGHLHRRGSSSPSSNPRATVGSQQQQQQQQHLLVSFGRSADNNNNHNSNTSNNVGGGGAPESGYGGGPAALGFGSGSGFAPPQQDHQGLLPTIIMQRAGHRPTASTSDSGHQFPRPADPREPSTTQAGLARAGGNDHSASAMSTASHSHPVLSSKSVSTLATQQPLPSSSLSQAIGIGRSTPQSSSQLSDDMTVEEVGQLVKDHKELREKYIKVKKYYFEKEDQVKQLQNSLANQRLALSRTSLDDAEYATRFSRLDGLTAQLAFGIRKTWKTVPSWLAESINKDAIATGKQEMTAAGRAFISCWLVEELFEKYFHPDLEPQQSAQLKTIQKNIRRLAPVPQTSDEDAAISSRVISWRLATLDSFKDVLQLQQESKPRKDFQNMLKAQLINALSVHLQDPPMQDLDGGVEMIIELAVGVAAHLPLESRDIHVDYFMPGLPFSNDLMKLETGIPALGVSVADDATDARSKNYHGPQSKNTLGDSVEDGATRVRMAIGIGAYIRYKTTLVKAPVFGT